VSADAARVGDVEQIGDQRLVERAAAVAVPPVDQEDP
jgi:hypothetical protein